MNRDDFRIEVCANGVESCLAAQAGGADRVELCAGMSEGGTTPSYGEIVTAKELLHTTRLHVIIRPRGGDFLYTPLEVRRMISDIELCKRVGVDGVVFGCLTPEGDIDMQVNAALMEHAEGMSVTFHRAFDRCRDPFQALEQLIDLNFDRILTSGQQPNAEKGMDLLRQLNEQAQHRIELLAGCGVNEHNILRIAEYTHIREFHFSARERVHSKMLFSNSAVYMGTPDRDDMYTDTTSEQKVRNTIAALIDTNI